MKSLSGGSAGIRLEWLWQQEDSKPLRRMKMNCDINQVIVELDVYCGIDQAWKVMVERMADWWPTDFLCLPGSQSVIFEAHAGGRLYEKNESGGELLWSNVLAIVPGQYVELYGPVTPAFGGPSLNFIRMELIEAEGYCQFRLTNSIVGHFSDASREHVEQGWRYLFGAYKAFCEMNSIV